MYACMRRRLFQNHISVHEQVFLSRINEYLQGSTISRGKRAFKGDELQHMIRISAYGGMNDKNIGT